MGSPVPPDVLHGPRLDLVLVTVEQLLARADADGPVPLGFDDPTDVLHPDRAPLRYRVPQVIADPSTNPWLLRLAVLREAYLSTLADSELLQEAAAMRLPIEPLGGAAVQERITRLLAQGVPGP